VVIERVRALPDIVARWQKRMDVVEFHKGFGIELEKKDAI
jgi:hypothetical protein